MIVEVNVYNIFGGPQVEAWVSAHNTLLATLGQGRPDVKVISSRVKRSRG